MKTPCTVIFLALYTAWMCSAIQGAPPTASEINVNGTEEADDLALDMVLEDDDEESDESPFTVEDLKEELARQLEKVNEIEAETSPTKKRQHANIRNSDPYPHHYHRTTDPIPYYPAAAPMPYAMPYSQCSYSQPLYYPQPMYPPYPYPPYSPIPFADQQSSHKIVKAAIDSKDTTEVVNIEELLKIANFWNKQNEKTALNKTATTKDRKRLSIRNWIRNKKNKFTTAAPPPAIPPSG